MWLSCRSLLMTLWGQLLCGLLIEESRQVQSHRKFAKLPPEMSNTGPDYVGVRAQLTEEQLRLCSSGYQPRLRSNNMGVWLPAERLDGGETCIRRAHVGPVKRLHRHPYRRSYRHTAYRNSTVTSSAFYIQPPNT